MSGEQSILIVVNNSLTLNAGTVVEGHAPNSNRTVYHIQPPETTMFDQLVQHLVSLKPNRAYISYTRANLGIAIAQLAIRWGSYLATLLDEQAPRHPILTDPKQVKTSTLSHISDSEMKRLNIEISTNLALLGDLYRQNEILYYQLLGTALETLPPLVRTAKPNKHLEQSILSAFYTGALATHLKTHPESLPNMIAQYPEMEDVKLAVIHTRDMPAEASANPSRVIANFLANHLWRNTLVENYHSGTHDDNAPLLPHQCRFTPKDARALLRPLIDNSVSTDWMIKTLYRDRIPSDIVSFVPPYPGTANALYNSQSLSFTHPHNWTFTDTSSVVTLYT